MFRFYIRASRLSSLSLATAFGYPSPVYITAAWANIKNTTENSLNMFLHSDIRT